MQIHATQNIGKVWISRKKNLPVPIWAHPRHHLGSFGVNFSMDRKNAGNRQFLFIFLGGPLADMLHMDRSFGLPVLFILTLIPKRVPYRRLMH